MWDGMSGGKVHGPCKFSGCVSVFFVRVAWCWCWWRWRAVADLRRNTITTNNHCQPVCNESVIVGVVHGSVE